MTTSRLITLALMLGVACSLAEADLTIRWSTLDGGGDSATGGVFTIHATIGQHDTGSPASGTSFDLQPGFWPLAVPLACPADINGDGVLNLDDVNLFAAGFIAGDLALDQNADGVLNLDDINLFAQGFLAGCP
ncbi:MAG: GC-type dockerin domain-anchored protein [Phycisphaerales bacterium]